MASKIYFKNYLSGGSANALDGIDGDLLAFNDCSITVTSAGDTYFHTVITSAGADDGLYRIDPDVNPGNKQWQISNICPGELSAYSTNAEAISGGLSSGEMYRTGNDPDVICIVH